MRWTLAQVTDSIFSHLEYSANIPKLLVFFHKQITEQFRAYICRNSFFFNGNVADNWKRSDNSFINFFLFFGPKSYLAKID